MHEAIWVSVAIASVYLPFLYWVTADTIPPTEEEDEIETWLRNFDRLVDDDAAHAVDVEGGVW